MTKVDRIMDLMAQLDDDELKEFDREYDNHREERHIALLKKIVAADDDETWAIIHKREAAIAEFKKKRGSA